jgi:hypothetical protein
MTYNKTLKLFFSRFAILPQNAGCENAAPTSCYFNNRLKSLNNLLQGKYKVNHNHGRVTWIDCVAFW